jgi:hypothetical protein
MEFYPSPELITNNNNDFKNNINKNKQNKNNEHSFVAQSSFGVYFITIKNNKNNIEIICGNTESNEKYNKNFNSDSLSQIMNVNNIETAFGILKQLKGEDVSVEPEDDIVSLKTYFDGKNMKFELDEDLDINDTLKKLKSENKFLKNKINELKEKIEIMNLNCEYNLFNVESYKLENIFKKLVNDKKNSLITQRAELGLINQGIKHLLNKNIVYMDIIYSSDINGEKPELFKENYNNENLIYSIIIIKTKDDNRFGIFCNREKILNQNLNNIIDNIPIIPMLQNNMNNINQNNFNMGNQNNGKINFYMQQNNNNMINNNMNQNIDIFSSNSISNKFFIFSLDDLSIYYSNDENTNNFPKFEIKYDNNRQCLFGIESYQNLNTSYKLSGKNNFNISKYELFEIELAKIFN